MQEYTGEVIPIGGQVKPVLPATMQEYTGEVIPTGGQVKPTLPAPAQPQASQNRDLMLGNRGNIISDIAGMASGGATDALAGLAGIVGSVLPGPEGQGADWVRRAQSAIPTYRPEHAGAIGTAGQLLQEASSEGGEKLGGVLGNANVGRLVGDVAPTIVGSIFGVRAPLKSIATTKYTGTGVGPAEGSIAAESIQRAKENAAKEASSADWQSAARIESSRAARELPHPINLNPAASNPSVKTRVMSIAADNTRVNFALSRSNRNSWGNNVKADMGISEDTPLTSSKPFDKVREKYAAPYNEVKKISSLADDGEIAGQLEQSLPPDLAVNQGAAPKVQSVIDNLKEKINAGMSGAQALDEIRALRASAKSLYDSDKLGKPDPINAAVADAHMKLADGLENLIEKNAPADLVPRLRESRKKMATSYIYENATDFNTGLVDPNIIARQTASSDKITGIAKKIGQVAGNHPEIADISQSLLEPKIAKFSRAGPAGALGMGAATMLGGPIGPAMALSAAAGGLGSLLARKRILSKAYQDANAVPVDRRIHPTENVPFDQRGLLTGEQ